MTPAGISLLKQLIVNDRRYWQQCEAYRQDPKNNDIPDLNQRGVEIGWINGVNPRTARALEDLGLIETLDIYGNGCVFAFLGSYNPHVSYRELFKEAEQNG
jgi:hypothetical protein